MSELEKLCAALLAIDANVCSAADALHGRAGHYRAEAGRLAALARAVPESSAPLLRLAALTEEAARRCAEAARALDATSATAREYVTGVVGRGNGGGTLEQAEVHDLEQAPGVGAPSLRLDPGVTLSSSEEAAAQFWVSRGHHVRAVKPVQEHEVKTGDLHVDGVGRVEIYSPQSTTRTDMMVRRIIAKSRQASILHVEVVSTDATDEQLRRMDRRVFGHPSAGTALQRLVLRREGRLIFDSERW